jgi:hypothetical protein
MMIPPIVLTPAGCEVVVGAGDAQHVFMAPSGPERVHQIGTSSKTPKRSQIFHFSCQQLWQFVLIRSATYLAADT